MNKILYKETVATANFANPDLCRHLQHAGLYVHSEFRWEMINHSATHARLVTYAFDPDDYYRHGNEALRHISSPRPTIPAYSLPELERLVPGDYTIAFSLQAQYIIMPSTVYPELEGCTATRLPDLFATHLLECFKKRVVDIAKAKQIQS